MTSHKHSTHEPLLPKSTPKGHQQHNASSHSHDAVDGPLLNRLENIHSAQEFLEECTYFIELKGKIDCPSFPLDIYELNRSCFYHEDMDYCPVEVKIKSEEIMRTKDCKYLLQVWKQGGKKVFEKKLQGEVAAWAVAYKYFIYKPGNNDENSDCFHIVNLKDNITHLVRDITNDPTYKYITFGSKKLYIANENTIQVFDINLSEEKKDQIQEVAQPYVINIRKDISRIHGLFTNIQTHKFHDHKTGELKQKKETLIIVALETNDQQIDFNELKLNKPTSLNAELSHKLIQYREVIPRRHYTQKDPIQVFKTVFKKTKQENVLISAVKRASGAFDLYYAGSRVYTSRDTKVRDIDLSFNFVIMIMANDRFTKKELRRRKGEKIDEDAEAQEERDVARNHGEEKKTLLDLPPNESRIRLINLKWESKIGYENSDYIPHLPDKNLFYWRIKDHCKIFTSFCLVGTVLLVAHGNTISLFSILTQKWVKHFNYSQEIVNIFRDAHEKQVTALFADSTLKVIKQQKLANTGEDQEPWIEDPNIKIELPRGEKLVDYHFDRENNEWIMLITQRGSKEHKTFGVYCIYGQKLYDITDQFDQGFHAKPNLVFLFSVNEHTEFIVQHHHQIDLYQIDFEEVKDENEEEKEEELELEEKDNKDDDDNEGKEVKVEVKVKEVLKLPKIRPVSLNIDTAEYDEHGHIKKKLIKRKISDGVKFQLHEQNHHRSKPKYFLFLSDTKNFYKIDLGNAKITVFENQGCQGLFFSDNNYLYTLSHIGPNRKQGLRLYDLENVMEKNKDYSYLLTGALQVGCQGHIDFSHENERISFLSSYDSIEVIPLLHRNTMSFIGMKSRNSFLATKVVDGQFLALSNKGKLYCWDFITGKLLPESKTAPTYKQYKDYEVYSWDDEDEGVIDTVYKKEWYSKILLKKKTCIENFDKDKYKGHGGIVEGIENQVAYKDRIEQKFYEFKIIEIINEREVKEHMTFVHGIYPDCVQFIYFSDDLKYMYERHKYEKHFIYEAKSEPQQDCQNNVFWQYIHRLHHLPLDLLNVTQYPFIMTPCFTKYLDVDESHTELLIRSTFEHEEIIAHVPKELVDGKLSSLEEAVKRLKWIDNKLLLLINEEGIERIVDTTDNFKEVAFNFIPLYDKTICQKTHYILDHPTYRLQECLETLKIRYRSYKSSYNMKLALDPDYDLYNDIFAVDYRIDNCNGQFEVDMGFSILHWGLTEQLHAGHITLDQIDNGQIQLLFYNIFPHGETVLHKLHDNGDLIEALFKIAHPNPEDPKEINIHVPILKNMNHKSALHLCAEHSEFRYINVMLDYLSAYPIDHHSRAINEVLPVMVEHSLPNFIPYLESRVRQTEQSSKVTKGMLKETNTHCICATSLWIGDHAIEQLFQPAPIEQDVRLQFIDIPSIHCFTSETGVEFFKALAESEDMRLFETAAVKKLIEFQWPLILKYTILRLFVPFLLFLASYNIYMRVLFGDEAMATYSPGVRYFGKGLLAFFSVYLLGSELNQLVKQGFEYFLSVWNYLDILPPAMILIFLGLDSLFFFADDAHLDFKASMQALMSLFIWLKFLYFLRIFDSTGYLIRIIIQVIHDMRHFLLVLLLTFIAFGDAIRNISDSNEEQLFGGGFVGGIIYIYRMVLGDFDTSEFGTVAVPLMWTLWLLCTVFNMIIMLNLLIAIISESFAAINEVSAQASYQEKASMISENLYLVPQGARAAFCSSSSYLLNAVDTEQELNASSESLDQKLHIMRKKLMEHNDKMFGKLEKRIKKQGDQLMRLAGMPGHGMSMSGSIRGGGSVYNLNVSQHGRSPSHH